MATSISFLLTSPFCHRGRTASPTKVPTPVITCAGSQTPQLLEAAAKHVVVSFAPGSVLPVDNYIKSGMVVGLGPGNASTVAIQHIGTLLQARDLKGIVGIPMSVSSAGEAAKAGIPLKNFLENLQVDFAFNDADAIEERSLAAVIGRRKLEAGESILQEKSIVKSAKTVAFILKDKQYNTGFEGSIPVVIKKVNWREIAEEIEDMYLGDAEVWRRASFGHADPLGGDFPLITNEGHHILDIIFTSPVFDLSQVAKSLDRIDGVVDHGLVVDVPSIMVIASQNGLEIIDNVAHYIQ